MDDSFLPKAFDQNQQRLPCFLFSQELLPNGKTQLLTFVMADEFQQWKWKELQNPEKNRAMRREDKEPGCLSTLSIVKTVKAH